MRHSLRHVPVLALASLVAMPALAAACEPGEPASTFGTGGNASTASGSSGDKTTSGIITGTPGDPAGEPGSPGSSGGLEDGGSCAAVRSPAMIQPLNMVVMYDKSGSMGDTDESSSYLPSLRWLPVGDAMKAFFAQGASAGINAYLSFFPNAAVWSTNPQHCYSANRYTTDQCNVANYNTVPPRTPLPSTGLANIIDGAQPCGDTPTRAALDGAYAQIANIKAGHPQEQTVLVLVTDGEPTDHCAAYGNTINEIVPVVTGQRTTNRVSTYVVGVGPSVDNMTRIATAGGTTLFHVDVGSSSTTTQQLLDAMTQIRGQLAKCDFPIPSPSDGRTLDYNKVNVSFTKNGSTQLLAYNPACSGGTGWKFDVEPGAAGATPTKVVLCSATCDDVKVAAGGNVSVEFGCIRRDSGIH